MSKWLMAELIRLLHTTTTDEATELVESLIEREVALIWSHEDKRRVLQTDLSWKQQVLVLLLAETGDVAEGDLIRWLEHKNPANLRKDVLRPMHRARLVEYDASAKTIRLLPPGVSAAEDIVRQGSA